MVHFRPGSQVWQIITLLSFVGEFPFKSLSLLGRERVYKALISRLTTLQTIRNFNSGDEITCRLLTVSGKGAGKTIRLYKGALPILEWLYPGVYGYYMDSFWGHRFPGDVSHRDRNHRVAEAAAMFLKRIQGKRMHPTASKGRLSLKGSVRLPDRFRRCWPLMTSSASRQMQKKQRTICWTYWSPRKPAAF